MAEKKRILVVDDEESLVYFLSEHLAGAGSGFEVETASSAQEAVLKMEERPPDLVITDLRMPGVDGLQLLTWIRSAYPDTRMILMTAYGSDEVQAEARRLEVYRYLTKPFRVQELVAAAEGALGEIALSGQGMLVLSGESFGAITAALEALRVDVGARCVLMSDSLGQLVTRAGVVHDLDTGPLLALLSGVFLATLELGRRRDQIPPAAFSYVECEDEDVCTVAVNEELYLILVFDKETEASRVGTVWFYARQAAGKLNQMLEASARRSPAEERVVGDASIPASLIDELTDMLTDLQLDAEPADVDHPPRESVAPRDRAREDSAGLPDRAALPRVPSLLDIEAAIELGLISHDSADTLRAGHTGTSEPLDLPTD